MTRRNLSTRENLVLKYEPGRKAERNSHWCEGR